MFTKGRIVYHNNVIFGDNQIDLKDKRPCVVLFSVEYNGNTYVCTCPFTSQVKAFNRHPECYQFISEQIYAYRKLSFAKLNSIRLYPIEETHDTAYVLDETIVDSIVNAFLKMPLKEEKDYINQIKYLLQYDKLFSELEKREISKTKKLERNNKRREAKRFV